MRVVGLESLKRMLAGSLAVRKCLPMSTFGLDPADLCSVRKLNWVFFVQRVLWRRMGFRRICVFK
jgi:hypothetical protein